MLMAIKQKGENFSSIAALRLFSDRWFELCLKVLHAIEKIKKMLNLYRHKSLTVITHKKTEGLLEEHDMISAT